MNPGTYWFEKNERLEPEPWFWAGVPSMDQFRIWQNDAWRISDGPLMNSWLGNSWGNIHQRMFPKQNTGRPIAFPNPFKYRLLDVRGMHEFPSGSGNYVAWYDYPAGLWFIPDGDVPLWYFYDIPDTTIRWFNSLSGAGTVFVPEVHPLVGVLIVVGRNGVGTTPGSATPYSLTLEVNGSAAWTQTVNPLADPPDRWWVPMPTPLDAAMVSLRSTVAQDDSHPHRMRIYGLNRSGAWHTTGDLPAGYTATVPPPVQAMAPTFQNLTWHAGKGLASALSYYQGGYDMVLSPSVAGMDVRRVPSGKVSRVSVSNDIKDVAFFDRQSEGNAEYTSGGSNVLSVDESGIIDWWARSITDPGGSSSTFTVSRDSNWGRGGGTGSVTLGSWTTGTGPGIESGSLTLSETVPPGGGYVTISRSGGTWFSMNASCRRAFSGRPIYPTITVDAGGNQGILPGGIHPGQVVTTQPKGAFWYDGPAGGGELEIDLATAPSNSTPFYLHVRWPDCSPGIFCAEYAYFNSTSGTWDAWSPAGRVVTGVSVGYSNDYIAYTHKGVRSLSLSTSRGSTLYTKIRVRTIKATPLVAQNVGVGVTALTRPSTPTTPSWLPSYVSTMPYLFKLTAPADGYYRIRVTRKGYNDTMTPDLANPSVVERTTAADIDGYRWDGVRQVYPLLGEITHQVSALLGIVRPVGIATSVPTSYAYADGPFASWLISAAVDWTGTAWAGQGGKLAVCGTIRTSASGAQPLPANPNWQFFDVPRGTTYANYDSDVSAYRMCIRSGEDPSGWVNIPAPFGVVVYDETIQMTAADVAQFRIAYAITTQGSGGWPAASYAGHGDPTSRYSVEVNYTPP